MPLPLGPVTATVEPAGRSRSVGARSVRPPVHDAVTPRVRRCRPPRAVAGCSGSAGSLGRARALLGGALGGGAVRAVPLGRRRGVAHGGGEVEQVVDAALALLGAGEGPHGVDERRDGVGHRDRGQGEQRLDRCCGVEPLGDDRHHDDRCADGDEEERRCGSPTETDPAGDPGERGVGVVEPAEGCRPPADGPQLVGLRRHQLADPGDLGAGGEQVAERARLEVLRRARRSRRRRAPGRSARVRRAAR